MKWLRKHKLTKKQSNKKQSTQSKTFWKTHNKTTTKTKPTLELLFLMLWFCSLKCSYCFHIFLFSVVYFFVWFVFLLYVFLYLFFLVYFSLILGVPLLFYLFLCLFCFFYCVIVCCFPMFFFYYICIYIYIFVLLVWWISSNIRIVYFLFFPCFPVFGERTVLASFFLKKNEKIDVFLLGKMLASNLGQKLSAITTSLRPGKSWFMLGESSPFMAARFRWTWNIIIYPDT